MHNKKENPFYNLAFNIILPVLILNKGHVLFPSEKAHIYGLLLALSFPFFYGLKDFIKDKKINALSLIGLVGTGLTGGLALMQLEGIYFAIKEAAIPMAIALFCVGSVFVKKPLAYFFILNSAIFKTKKIKEKLKENNTEKQFEKVMKIATLILSASFVLSAILNFIIALFVFETGPEGIEENVKRELLNKQIADMTWMGYVFIAVPLSVILVFLFWWILKQLKILTGLNLDEIT